MSKQWYYAIDGEQHGPVSAAELKRLADARELSPDDWVRPTDAETWLTASRVKGLFSPEETVEAPPTQAEAAQDTPPVVVQPEGSASDSPSVSSKSEAKKQPLTSSERQQQLQWRLLKFVAAGVVFVLIIAGSVYAFQKFGDFDFGTDEFAADRSEPEAAAEFETYPEGADDSSEKVISTVRGVAGEEPVVAKGVEVAVLSVEIARPRVLRMDGRGMRPTNPYLVVDLQITAQTDAEKTVTYHGWGPADEERSPVRLVDKQRRELESPHWSGVIEGQVRERQELLPGESLSDRLVFQRPEEDFGDLYLLLPTDALAVSDDAPTDDDDPLAELDRYLSTTGPTHILLEIPGSFVVESQEVTTGGRNQRAVEGQPAYEGGPIPVPGLSYETEETP